MSSWPPALPAESPLFPVSCFFYRLTLSYSSYGPYIFTRTYSSYKMSPSHIQHLTFKPSAMTLYTSFHIFSMS